MHPEQDPLNQDELPSRPPRHKGIYLIPNLLTTSSLFAGFYGIVAAIDGNFEKASVAIFIAMIIDGLDGRVARLTSTETEFGAEYDSLSDMVAFGLAPAIIVYQWGLERLVDYGWIWGKLGWLAAFFYAVAAALRLARFNTIPPKGSKKFFEGLPSPTAAAAVIGLVWLGSDLEWSGGFALFIACVVTAAAAGLMVARVPYYSFKEFSSKGQIAFSYAFLMPLSFVLIALNPPLMLFAMAAGYSISGPLWLLWRRQRRQQRGTAAEASPVASSEPQEPWISGFDDDVDDDTDRPDSRVP